MIPIHQRWGIEMWNFLPFLSLIAHQLKPTHYLELGVQFGPTFVELSKHCAKVTGVDILPIQFELPSNAEYVQSTTDIFFRQLPDDVMFDMIFIDGDHSHAQSLTDFNNAQAHLTEDGLILLHDTYPPNTDFLHTTLCGEAYKTALHIKNHMSNEFEVVTLPFPPGLTIIRKIKKGKQLLWL